MLFFKTLLSKAHKVYRNKVSESYCGIVVENPKLVGNIGVLFRTSVCMGNVNFLGTIGESAYNSKDNRWDPIRSSKILPCWHWIDVDDFFNHIPKHCNIVGVELDNRSVPLEEFIHPPRAIYIFGNEGYGLSPKMKKRCKQLIKLPGSTGISMNLSSAGSIVLWDRYYKGIINE